MPPRAKSTTAPAPRLHVPPTKAHTHADLDHFRGLLAAHMQKKQLRATDQRRLIVEAFFSAPNHVSIEELLRSVRAEDGKVGYATVYRTLKLLVECGVAFERKFGDGLTRFELADDDGHHDHLICVECGDITEFEEPRLEAIEEAIAKRYGFLTQSHKHEMYGVCRACQQRRRGGREGAQKLPQGPTLKARA